MEETSNPSFPLIFIRTRDEKPIWSDKRFSPSDTRPHENRLRPFLALVAGGLAGCNLKEKYARNNLAADRWLQANRGTASISVERAWEAWESG